MWPPCGAKNKAGYLSNCWQGALADAVTIDRMLYTWDVVNDAELFSPSYRPWWKKKLSQFCLKPHLMTAIFTWLCPFTLCLYYVSLISTWQTTTTLQSMIIMLLCSVILTGTIMITFPICLSCPSALKTLFSNLCNLSLPQLPQPEVCAWAHLQTWTWQDEEAAHRPHWQRPGGEGSR